MAKQKFEITTFQSGIIANPSETDIPHDAASFSLNVNPVTEDGTLRGINDDTVLTKTKGWQNLAKQIERITIKKIASSDSNISGSFSSIADSDGIAEITWSGSHGLETGDYIMFTGSGGTDSDYYDNENSDGEAQPQQVEKVDATKFRLIDAAAFASGKITGGTLKIVSNATHFDYSSQFLEIKTISDAMYIWFDQGSGGDVDPNLNTYDEGLGDEGQGTNFDDYDDTRRIEVSIANSATKATIAEAIADAINTTGTIKATHTSGDVLTLESTENGEVELMMITPSGGGSFGIDDSVITKTISTPGEGTPFNANDFCVVNETDDIFTIIGVDYSENEILKWEDIYKAESNDDERSGTLISLATSALNDGVSAFSKRDKAVHIGLGDTQTSYTKWVGRIDNTQFDNVYNDWYVENDKLDPMSEGLSPVNFDHISTYPSWGTSTAGGVTTAFAENQTHHAAIGSITNTSGGQEGENLNSLFHHTSGEVRIINDANYNRYGKVTGPPKIGWVFAISDTNDTGDGALLAAKRWAFDDDCSLATNDLFMVVDPDTAGGAGGSAAQVEYIGNVSGSPFGYGFNEGGRYVYKISMNPEVDADMFDENSTTVANARYRKYDIIEHIDESGISSMTPCRTPITSGNSVEKSDYLVYGDGTVDKNHIADQRCRPLYGMWWVSTMAGRLYRVNLMDIDSKHNLDEYKGPKSDCEMTFDYGNIARCQDTTDTGVFKHWYGGIYGAPKAAAYISGDGTRTEETMEGVIANDFTSGVTWSRTPVNSRIVAIIETFNNHTSSADFTKTGVISQVSNNDRYAFDDDSDKAGLGANNYGDDTDNANKDNSDYAADFMDHHHACLNASSTKEGFTASNLIDVKVPWHGLDTGNVVTFYKGDSSGNDLGHDDNNGNSVINRIIGSHQFRCTGTYNSGDGEKATYHSSKVWVLYQNKDGAYYSGWDLMLYNWYPTTVSTSSSALAYDRTPPYDEVDIGTRTGNFQGSDSFWLHNLNGNQQSGAIVCQKSSQAFARTGFWSQDGDYAGNTTGNDPYCWRYQRRDGSVICANMNREALTQGSFGKLLGWDGSASTNNPRKVKPLEHTLHHLLDPIEMPQSKHDTFLDASSTTSPDYTDTKFDGAHLRSGGNKHQVGFLARVSGRMAIDGYACYYRNHEHHSHMDQHYGAFKTYNDELVQFTVTDTGSSYNDTRTYNGSYHDHEGDNYISTNQTSHYSDGGKFKQRAFYDGSSLKYIRGTTASALLDTPGTKYSSYSGTFLVPNTVSLGNTATSSESARQGQIGDYLYIDRKWLSGEPNVGSAGGTSATARSLANPDKNELVFSNKKGAYCWENHGGTTTAYMLMEGNQRPYYSGSPSQKIRGYSGGFHGNTSGHTVSGAPGGSGSGHFGPSRSSVIAASIFYSKNDTSTLAKYHTSWAPWIWDLNRWNMSCEIMHKNVCQMKSINETFGKLVKVRSAHLLSNRYFTSLANGDTSLSLTNGDSAKQGKNNLLFINGSKVGATDYASVLSLSSHNTDNSTSLDAYYNDNLRSTTSYDDTLVAKEIPDAAKIVSTFWSGHWSLDENGGSTETAKMFYTGQKDGKTFMAPPAAPHTIDLENNSTLAHFEDVANISNYTNFPSIIEVMSQNAGTKKTFLNGQNIKYKLSLLYDGFQDGPLSPFFADFDCTQDSETLTLEVKINLDGNMSKRVTHLVLWRKNTDNELYRMVKQIKLTLDNWNFNNSLNTWVHRFTDSGSFASYSAITGIDEDVTDFSLNYGLSANINDQLFVAKGFHPEIEDASKYIFRSKPGNWSQFDYSKDYLVLDTKPTALASYNGKIYAFDRKNTYRINPEQMYVEDTFEGVGCLGPDAFVVTEFGMCFADRNNIYIHDGAKPVPIGTPILNVSTYDGANIGWKKAVVKSEDVYNTPPSVFYDGRTHSFVAFLLGSCDQNCAAYVSRAWAYNIGRGRWDYWEAPQTQKVAQGKDGDILIAGQPSAADATLLYNYKDSSTLRDYRWLSKQMSITKSIDKKRFHRIKLSGNPILSTISSPGNWKDDIVVYVDGKIQDLSIINKSYTQSSTNVYTLGDHSTGTNIIGYAGINAGSVMGDIPAVGSYIKVQDEIMKITAIDTIAKQMTVDRAQLGTTAQTHNQADAPGSSGTEGYEGHSLFIISPTIKLPSKCKGKNIQVMLRNQKSFIDSFGIEFISKNTK